MRSAAVRRTVRADAAATPWRPVVAVDSDGGLVSTVSSSSAIAQAGRPKLIQPPQPPSQALNVSHLALLAVVGVIIVINFLVLTFFILLRVVLMQQRSIALNSDR